MIEGLPWSLFHWLVVMYWNVRFLTTCTKLATVWSWGCAIPYRHPQPTSVTWSSHLQPRLLSGLFQSMTKLAELVMLWTCVWEVPGSNLIKTWTVLIKKFNFSRLLQTNAYIVPWSRLHLLLSYINEYEILLYNCANYMLQLIVSLNNKWPNCQTKICMHILFPPRSSLLPPPLFHPTILCEEQKLWHFSFCKL